MNFNSFLFVAFFAAVLLGTLALPQRARNLFLLGASVVFYATWSWKLFGLLVLAAGIQYGAALAIGRASERRAKRAWLAAACVLGLAILGSFKYWNFFLDSFDLLVAPLGWSAAGMRLDLVLPLGISFYTLQSLGYTIDVYRGHFAPVRSFPDFLLYVSFFPQLIAGPIERAPRLLPQIARTRRIDAAALHEGALLAGWGFFKKVAIADNLARLVDPVFARSARPDGTEVAIATLAFTILAYADFSGYSDIARGTARMLGFQLVRNFDTPYLSRDMGEFWRRWHVSLSTWLRDYLFLSLGGSRVGAARLTLNLWITLFLAGLWHGADGSFVLFGIFHGTLVAGTYWYRRWRPVRPEHAAWPAVVLTFLTFAFTMVAFRAEDGPHSLALYGALFSGGGFRATDAGALLMVAVCALPLLVTDLLERRYGHDLYLLGWPAPARALVYVAVFYAIVLFGRAEGYEFLYFQF